MSRGRGGRRRFSVLFFIFFFNLARLFFLGSLAGEGGGKFKLEVCLRGEEDVELELEFGVC